ncbi:MAG TPA: hypothetical protein VFH47_03220 [Candidatus Thermoplasmatota archaeon]|nr:hypothetical protein [Candidatus Thermoplasmatota archaeon]
MRLLPVLLAAGLALAGCGSPGAVPVASPPQASCHEGAPAPGEDVASCAPTVPRHVLRVRVTGGPGGSLLPGAEVYAVPAQQVRDVASLGVGRYTDEAGEAGFLFEGEQDLLVLVLGPRSTKWAPEAVRVRVGAEVQGEEVLVEGRTVVVPLLLSEVVFQAAGEWGPVLASDVGAPAAATFPADLGVPPAVACKYLERAKRAEVRLAWTNTPSSLGDLYAGIAWDGAVASATPQADPSKAVALGPREAAHAAEAAPPAPCAPFEAAALTDRAIHGTLQLTFSGRLLFEDGVPDGVPLPTCLAARCATV